MPLRRPNTPTSQVWDDVQKLCAQSGLLRNTSRLTNSPLRLHNPNEVLEYFFISASIREHPPLTSDLRGECGYVARPSAVNNISPLSSLSDALLLGFVSLAGKTGTEGEAINWEIRCVWLMLPLQLESALRPCY